MLQVWGSAAPAGDWLLTIAVDHTRAPELEADLRSTESPHSSDTLGNGNGERVESKSKTTAKKNKQKVGFGREIKIIPEGLKQPVTTSGLGEVFLWTDCSASPYLFLHLSLVHLV